MGKGTIKTKAMTMAVAMSMVAGLCPSTVFAANSEDVAKVQDGTYTGKAKCSPNRKNQFDEYELSLKVTIENGKIVSIDNVNGNGDADNDDYISDAVNGYDEYESCKTDCRCQRNRWNQRSIWSDMLIECNC